MADTSYISMRSTCHVQTGNIDIKYTWYKSIEKIIIRLSNTLPQIKHFIHSLSWFFCKILSSNMFYWTLMIMIDRFTSQAIWCISQIVYIYIRLYFSDFLLHGILTDISYLVTKCRLIKTIQTFSSLVEINVIIVTI